MDALAGFFVFGVSLAAIVAVTEVNGKWWWASLLGILAGGPIVIAALPVTMPGSARSVEAAALAFVVPVIILCVALSRRGSRKIAGENGS